MLFSKVNRQKCRVRLTVKKFQELKNLTISAALHGILAREESLNKPRHDITRPYNLLISENIFRFYKEKGQENLQNSFRS